MMFRSAYGYLKTKQNAKQTKNAKKNIKNKNKNTPPKNKNKKNKKQNNKKQQQRNKKEGRITIIIQSKKWGQKQKSLIDASSHKKVSYQDSNQ